MANHTRPLSNMAFSKSSNLPVENPKPNANENPNSNTNPKKYALRQKKIDRMSNRAIEEIIKKNERLEEENVMLKNEVEILKGGKAGENGSLLQVSIDIGTQTVIDDAVSETDMGVQVSMDSFANTVSIDTGTQTMVDDAVSGTDMGVQVSMDSFANTVSIDTGTQTMVDDAVSGTDMGVQVSVENLGNEAIDVSIESETATVADFQNFVYVKDAAVQAIISTSNIATMTIAKFKVGEKGSGAEYEVGDRGDAVEVNEAAAKIDNNILDLLPWLQVVREKNDFFNLERQLIFDETLQDDLISTAAVKINAPDEANFLKFLLARVFSQNFFVNTLAFNARGNLVQFKGSITLRCFAVAMARKFAKKEDEEEETIDKYKNKIQNFITDFKISSPNECNGIANNNYSEDSINPIKNQLQAELSSTLHRRQTSGNKKPNFIAPKNTTINAINNQLRELQNNAQNQPVTNGKTVTDAKQTKPSTDDKEKEEKPKLLISHGKPNFKISSNTMNSKKLLERDENGSGNELIGTLRRRLKSVEALDEMEPVKQSNDKLVNEQKLVPEAKLVVTEPQKNVRQQKTVQEQPNVSNSAPKSPPLFYKASVKNFNTVTSNISTDSNNEIKRTIRRLKSVELLEQTEKSTDEKIELNDIQRRIQNLKNVEIHKINSSSNGYTSEMRTDEYHKIESISVQCTTETDCFQSSPILPRRAQLFKQQQNLESSKITSPTIHHINHGTSNYKSKPITSFSRDLQLTPNRYPDKVAIAKTVEPEPVFFSDVKFIINSNGEVVRS